MAYIHIDTWPMTNVTVAPPRLPIINESSIFTVFFDLKDRIYTAENVGPTVQKRIWIRLTLLVDKTQ